MQNSPPVRQLFVSLGLALLASVLSFACWNAEFRFPFQQAFLLPPRSSDAELTSISLGLALVLMTIASIVTAMSFEGFGARRALPSLTAGLLALSIASLLISWSTAIDIQFMPLLISSVTAAVLVQLNRLCFRERLLTMDLLSSAKKLSSLQVSEVQSRLMSGLRLIETVLSPHEAVVFRFDESGELVVAARVRAESSGPLNERDAGRNATWRGGVKLCERSIKENSIICGPNENGAVSFNVALPLQHERRTVGAMLIRLGSEFEESDRDLLAAVGAQMARNLQREDALRSTVKPRYLSFFSARAAEQKFESLHVLNGLLNEQRFGVHALSYISEGLALAYLDGTLAYANSNLLKYADLSTEQLSNTGLLSLLDIFRTDVFDEPSIAVRRVLQTGEPFERELSYHDRDVTYGIRLSLVRANAGPEKGEPLCLAVHLSDLTSVKAHEKLKSDMISLMSHELRTPLTSINGFAELLTLEPGVPEQAKEFVTVIANESQRLSRMINTFLAVSQLQRKDKQEVMKIPLRLDEVAREIVTSLQPVARKRRIRLVEQQQSSRLPPVAADKSLITQAVKNLVNNAIKYSPERTTVTVTTALEADAVRVSVEDRGYGIPAEAKEKVWEKFYRVVREGQEKDEESTGLGLSFVREVVEQHGGHVGLETEEGRGSRFSFTLPRL